MAIDEPRSCPDPEILGAFLEGTLDPRTREEVSDHILQCNYCLVVVRETTAYTRESVPAKSQSPKFFLIAAGIAIALLGAAAIFFRDRTDSVRRLAQAAHDSGVRTIEGRMDSFEYARFTSTRSLGGGDTAITAAAKGVLDDIGTPDSATDWHTQGVANLLIDRIEQAVRELDQAARLRPKSAAYRSDLAAARIALGTSRQDVDELHRGLADAEAALQLDPTSSSAAFNRALALERLGERDAARKAYESYLQLDPKSPWSEEARWRLNRLSH